MNLLGGLLTKVFSFFGASAVTVLALLGVAGNIPVTTVVENVADDPSRIIEIRTYDQDLSPVTSVDPIIELDDEPTDDTQVLLTAQPALLTQAFINSTNNTYPTYDDRFAGLLAHVYWLISEDGRVVTSGNRRDNSRTFIDKQIERTTDDLRDSIDDSSDALASDVSDLDSRLLTAETTLASISLAAASTSVMAANLTLNGHWLSGDGADEGVFVTAAGNVGVGTSTASSRLVVAGDIFATGALRDSTNSAGTAGMVLQTTGSGTEWVATSTLGISGGGGSSLFTDAGAATYLTDSGDNLGIGTTTPGSKLTVAGDILLTNNLNLMPTTGSGVGVITVAGQRFIHNYTPDATYGRNIFMGYQAGNFTMGSSTNPALGNSNVGIGEGVLSSLTEGGSNTAVGFSALGANTTGGTNVAVGWYSMLSNTTGGANVAVGRGTLQSNMDGRFNTALGNAAMEFNVSGENNVAVGAYALQNTNAYYNVGIGQGAGGSITSGEANTIIGFDTGNGITTGGHNTIIGANVTGLSSTLSNNIIIADGSGNRRINVDSSGNVGLGTTTPSSRLTIAGDIFATGAFHDSTNSAGTAGMVLQTTGSGTEWVATSTLGFTSGGSLFTDAGSATYLTATGDNLAIGTTTAGSRLTIDGDIRLSGGINFGTTERIIFRDAASNVMFGSFALTYNNNADVYSNTAIGDGAAGPLVFGYSNALLGFSAGTNIATGSRSVIIGSQAVGSGTGNADLSSMVIIGDNAGFDLESGANWGTFVGTSAGENVTTGSGNTLLGYRAADNLTTGYNNIVIGFDIETQSASQFETLNIGNLIFGTGVDGTGTTLSSGNIGIGSSTPSTRFVVDGTEVASSDTVFTMVSPVARAAVLRFTNNGNNVTEFGLAGIDNSFFAGTNSGDFSIRAADDRKLHLGVDNGSGNNSPGLTIMENGSLGIGTTTPTSRLTVAGDINLTGGISFDGTRYVTASTTNDSIAFGESAGATFTDITTYNNAIGYQAGRYASTTAVDYNNFMGYRSGYNNTGSENNFIGRQSGHNNTGNGNNIFGYDAGYQNTGTYNNLFGQDSGYNNNGSNNNFFGFESGYNSSGNNNNFLGNGSGFSNAGDNNNFIGYQAGNSNSGANNNLIGYRAGYNNSANSVVAIGYEAMGTTTGSNSGFGNVGIGYRTLFNNTTGFGNHAIGESALENNTTGSINNAFGRLALSANTSGGSNSVFGDYAMRLNTTGGSNSAFGADTLGSNTTGGSNSAFGADTLGSNTTGLGNSAFGRGSLGNNTNGTYNAAFGNYALHYNVTGIDNAALGAFALNSNTDGNNNSALGNYAGQYLNDGTTAASTTDNSVFLGYGTRALTVDDQNAIVIGYNANGLGSNTVVLGNDSVTTTALKGNVGVGTTTPSEKLTVDGTIQSTDLLGGSTNLTTDASGNIIRDPSDARLKENVVTIENALETVLGLRGVRYEWIDKARFGDQFEIGFLAQEVDVLVPEVVQKGGEYWSLNSKNLIAVVVEAMKEMWATVSGHEERLVELESENSELKARLEAVEAELGTEPAPEPEPAEEEVDESDEEETTEPVVVDAPEDETEPADEAAQVEPEEEVAADTSVEEPESEPEPSSANEGG